MRLRLGGFRGQLLLSTVLLVAAVMVVLVGGTQAVLEMTAYHEIDRALVAKTASAMAVLAREGEPGDADLEPGTRVYDAAGLPVAGTIEQAVRAKAAAEVRAVLATHRQVTTDAPDDYHLQATPYAGGVVVVTQDANPYERSEAYALAAQIILGVIAVSLAGAVAWRVSRKALEPVARMARTATEWSEHDLTHRFDLGPPTNELAALGETLDHLLDRVAQAIRSEQRLTSELAHELRTPLTAIRGSAEIAQLRPPSDPELRDDLAAIATATRRMETVITTLLALARAPQAATDEASHIADAVARVGALVPSRLTLDVDVPADLPAVAASADLVVRALAPLVENAVQHASSVVTMTARAGGSTVELCVSDDGSGVAEEAREHLFEPGHSGRASSGLGLGIARRVARSLGGDVTLRDPATAEFVLTLPRA